MSRLNDLMLQREKVVINYQKALQFNRSTSGNHFREYFKKLEELDQEIELKKAEYYATREGPKEGWTC